MRNINVIPIFSPFKSTACLQTATVAMGTTNESINGNSTWKMCKLLHKKEAQRSQLDHAGTININYIKQIQNPKHM